MPKRIWTCLLLTSLWCAAASPALGDAAARSNLVHAILTEDPATQTELVKKLIKANDPIVEGALAAWRQGGLFLHETNETKTPFILDAAIDADGNIYATYSGQRGPIAA